MQKIMKAAVFKGEGRLEIENVPVPRINFSDDIILEVELCSICGTDVHIMEVPPGYIATPGTILGHELVGRVVAIGSGVKQFCEGDRVVVNPNDYCGICRFCRLNFPNLCENILPLGISVNGGFAEYCKVREKVAFKIDKDLPAEIAAFAEPLACVLNGTQKIKVQPGESVLVLGSGPIGLLFVQFLKAAGISPVIVSEISAVRRDFAKIAGADVVIDPRDENSVNILKEIAPIGVDVVIDVVGSLMSDAVSLVCKGGRILVFGINTRGQGNIKQCDVTMKELQVFGTWLANASFPKAVRLLESDLLNLPPFITHTLPLTEIHKGIELLARGEGVEILIEPR